MKDGILGVEDPRCKARFVIRGFDQRKGIDFNEFFFQLFIILSLVALFDLELEQLDVKTAFLHGDLNKELYMTQPEGFLIPDKEH